VTNNCLLVDLPPTAGLSKGGAVDARTGHSSGRWHIVRPYAPAESRFSRCGRDATEVLSATAWQALMESVDQWPMAIIICKTLGGKPTPVTAFGRDRLKVSSS
jgi:hypothetical protein